MLFKRPQRRRTFPDPGSPRLRPDRRGGVTGGVVLLLDCSIWVLQRLMTVTALLGRRIWEKYVLFSCFWNFLNVIIVCQICAKFENLGIFQICPNFLNRYEGKSIKNMSKLFSVHIRVQGRVQGRVTAFWHMSEISQFFFGVCFQTKKLLYSLESYFHQRMTNTRLTSWSS